jgi:hypothetical protein
LATLRVCEPLQHVVVDLTRQSPAALPEAAALWRNHDLAGAAVRGVEAALGQPGPFEPITVWKTA